MTSSQAISSQPPSAHAASTPWHLLASSNTPDIAVLFDAIADQSECGSDSQATRSDRVGGLNSNSSGRPIATVAAALARPAIIAPDNNSPGGHRHGAWPSAADASPCRSQQPTPHARPPAAPLRSPTLVISVADILTAPLADIARWAAAGLLAQVPLSTVAAVSQPKNVPDQPRVPTSMCPRVRPCVQCATSACEAHWTHSARPWTTQQLSNVTAYLTGLPSPKASPACSPVASCQLDARMIHDPALDSIPMSPMSLLSPVLPPPAAPVSLHQNTSSASRFGVLRRVPQLAPPSWRVQQPAQAIRFDPTPPNPHVAPTIPIGIQTRYESYPISPTPSSESASSVACSQPPSRSPSFVEPPPAAFVELVAGSPLTSASIRRRSVKGLPTASFSLSLKSAPTSFKSTRPSAAVPMQARPSPPPIPHRAALPPNTRIVRDADGGVAFEFSTPWSVQ